MERLSDQAIEIINELHTERLDYNSEYLPLIEAALLLAAYEDTGLEPEDIKVLKVIHGLPAAEIVRICNLYRAEKEGRLVVLPCKVGDEVWGIRNYRGVDHPQRGRVSDMFYTKDIRLTIVVKHICRGWWGKNVFATQEEAEAALKTQLTEVEKDG